EPVVVRQDEHGSRRVRPDTLERLLRPPDDQLVCAGDPLRGRELAASIGDERPPARLPRRARGCPPNEGSHRPPPPGPAARMSPRPPPQAWSARRRRPPPR